MNADWEGMLTQALRRVVVRERGRRFQRRRQWATAVALLGAADATYLLLFQTGAIRHLHCPFFGDACERISGSKLANPGGIPDAVFGVAGYLTLAGLLQWGPEERYERCPERALLCGGAALAAAGLSAFLTYTQKRRFNTFCFWCLCSAACSAALVPLLLPETRAAARKARF